MFIPFLTKNYKKHLHKGAALRGYCPIKEIKFSWIFSKILIKS